MRLRTSSIKGGSIRRGLRGQMSGISFKDLGFCSCLIQNIWVFLLSSSFATIFSLILHSFKRVWSHGDIYPWRAYLIRFDGIRYTQCLWPRVSYRDFFVINICSGSYTIMALGIRIRCHDIGGGVCSEHLIFSFSLGIEPLYIGVARGSVCAVSLTLGRANLSLGTLVFK